MIINELVNYIRELLADCSKTFSDEEIIFYIEKAVKKFGEDTLNFTKSMDIKLDKNLEYLKPKNYHKLLTAHVKNNILDEQNFENFDYGLPNFITDKKTNLSFDFFPNPRKYQNPQIFLFFNNDFIFDEEKELEMKNNFYGISEYDFFSADFYGTFTDKYKVFQNFGVSKKSFGVSKKSFGVESSVVRQRKLGNIFYAALPNFNDVKDYLAIIYNVLEYLFLVENDTKNLQKSQLFKILYKNFVIEQRKIRDKETNDNKLEMWSY